MFSSSFEAAGDRYFIAKVQRRNCDKKDAWILRISGLVFRAWIPRVFFQHAQLAFWEHVIMRKWRINREGIIAMAVLYELVTTISRRLLERGTLQLLSSQHTVLPKRRYCFRLNVRLCLI